MIDGNVNGQLIDQNSICASTKRGDNPWVRLDLKKTYLVSLVRVINFGTPGNNVAVRVGNSSNNGNDNYLCGNVPYFNKGKRKAIWRDVSCTPPEWGRYFNFNRTVKNHYLEICEAAFEYGQ